MLQHTLESFFTSLRSGHASVADKDVNISSEVRYLLDAAQKAVFDIKDNAERTLQIDALEKEVQKVFALYGGASLASAIENRKALTSIMASIQRTIADIKGLKNLPPEAVVIQNETIAIVEDSLKKTEVVQKATLDFVKANVPKLDVVKKEIEDPAIPIESILAKMNEIVVNAMVVKREADNLDVNVTMKKIGELMAQSKALENKYKGEVTKLEAQIAETQKSLAAAEERRWYFLALGIFGLPGLIAAIAVITSISNDLNAMNNQINALNANLVTVRNFASSISAFSTLYSELYGQIGYLKNDIDFVIGQLSNIIQNLNNPNVDRQVIALYVNATVDTMKQLEADAS